MIFWGADGVSLSTLHKISGCCENPARAGDVVFIHGLGGHAFDTWRTAPDDSASWPHWVGEEFSKIGVWSLSYDASATRLSGIAKFFSGFLSLIGIVPTSTSNGHTMALPQRATQVLDQMVQQGLGSKPIIFVCHSLGGLLAKQILRKSADATNESYAVYDQTCGVLFLATPHMGSILANFADWLGKIFRTTISVEELRAHDAHLEDLFNWYRNHAKEPKLQTFTYYETRALFGVTIVNPTSSHPGVGRDPVGLDQDHISIVKPVSRNDQVCHALRSLIRKQIGAEPLLLAAAIPGVSQAPAPGSFEAMRREIVQPAQNFGTSKVVATQENLLDITPAALVDTRLLNQQLAEKDKQIASLHNIINNVVSPDTQRPGESNQDDEIYAERVNSWEKEMDLLLDIDFSKACERGEILEQWIESSRSRLSKKDIVRLYHLLVRLEYGKVARNLRGASIEKAKHFLERAKNEIE